MRMHNGSWVLSRTCHLLNHVYQKHCPKELCHRGLDQPCLVLGDLLQADVGQRDGHGEMLLLSETRHMLLLYSLTVCIHSVY